MSNVVHLRASSQFQPQEARHAALLACFAEHRRFGDDVFWLKENAEILNILETSGAKVGNGAFEAHEDFYETVEKRLGFFPQYYRFLLSITLDLEALGMQGDKAERLVKWADAQGLAQAELSDLQRLEARRLMMRRGVDPLPQDETLEQRSRAFTERAATFALPNKKAAYELTHIIFYLSEYGRKDPQLAPETLTSLHYAGLLAFIDQNADLLAEVCVAMRFAGQEPPSVWETWLDRETNLYGLTGGEDVSIADDYHEFLVCNWHQAFAGGRAFNKPVEHGRMRFDRGTHRAGPLRELSECMFRLDDQRSGDWHVMRDLVNDTLSEDARDVLEAAETSSDQFEGFFEGFARAGIASSGVAL